MCFGRIRVDLYAEQIGSPLSSVESFAKYVGGSAANICVGCARLGLRTAMLTVVGNEDFGKVVLATLERGGVWTSLVQVEDARSTAVVALALRERDDFPRIFVCRDSPDQSVSVVFTSACDLAEHGDLEMPITL